MQQMWIFILIGVGVGYVVAFSRKGKVTGASMTSRQQTVTSAASPAEAFAALCKIGRPFVVDDSDASSNILVLSSPVTFFSWGFLYPVFITPNGSGSRILIGCGSKLFQMGPVVTNAHNKAVAAVEQALSVASARVVNG
jgi:hypothetical protein